MSYLNNNPVFVLATEGNISGYFYEINQSEANTVGAESNFLGSDGSMTIFNPGIIEDGAHYFHGVPFDGDGQLLMNQAMSFQFNIVHNSVSISSASHPDSSLWYENQSILLNIDAPFGVTKFHYELDQFPFTVPEVGVSTVTQNSSWVIPSLNNGTYFFHLIPEDSSGFTLTEPIRRRFNMGHSLRSIILLKT